MGEDWQRLSRETRHLDILTPYRSNQRSSRSPHFTAWLKGLRERIEGTFHEVQNTGRHQEHLRCKTWLLSSTLHKVELRFRRNPAGI